MYNIRKLEDVMTYINENNKPGIILNIDFYKVFDSVKWESIFVVLGKLNFGPTFINYIQMIYKNAQATSINNGLISDWFQIETGVRQGCPL